MPDKRETAKIAEIPTRNQSLRNAWLDWCALAIGGMDFDATLHLPQHLAHLPSGDVLSTSLRHCFNRLDRHFLGSAHRRHGLRIPRFVTLEYSKGVGWHAHISFKLWQDANGYVIDPHDFKAKLTELWLATTKQPKQGKFSALIACIKPTHANFLSYSLKNVDETEHRNGMVDTLNCAGDALLAA